MMARARFSRGLLPAAIVLGVLVLSYFGPFREFHSFLVSTTYQAAQKATGGGQGPVNQGSAGSCTFTTPSSTSTSGFGPATFGFNAKSTSATTANGELEDLDHANKTNIHGEVTTFTLCSSTKATFTGSYVVKKGACTPGTNAQFTATVEDNGEPGAGKDVFAITFDGSCTSENTSGIIAKGNIQVHSS